MLGDGIRAERLRRGLTQAQLGKTAGLSASMVSQIEKGTKSPSIEALRRIATGLGVPMFHFLAEDAPSVLVVRANQRRTIRFPQSALVYQSLMPSVESPLEMLLVKLPPGGTSGPKPLSHPADECLLVLRGTLDISTDGHKYTLGPGDSIYIPAGRKHLAQNVGHDVAEAVMAITPPRF